MATIPETITEAVGAELARPVEKRRRRSKSERRRIVEETLLPGASVARVARAHGVNANQVFAWRKLYHQGLLEDEASAGRLLPVRIADTLVSARRAAAKAAQKSRNGVSCRTVSMGTIDVALGQAHVRIEGSADPHSLRVVLECLLG